MTPEQPGLSVRKLIAVLTLQGLSEPHDFSKYLTILVTRIGEARHAASAEKVARSRCSRQAAPTGAPLVVYTRRVEFPESRFGCLFPLASSSIISNPRGRFGGDCLFPLTCNRPDGASIGAERQFHAAS